MKKNLFICYTPYHLILAFTIAEQLSLEQYLILFIDESAGKVLPESSFHRRNDLKHIKGRGWFDDYRILKVVTTWNLYLKIKGIIEDEFLKLEKLFVFNDTREDTQYLSKLIDEDTQVFAVEDGIEPYWSDELISWNIRGKTWMNFIHFLYGDFIKDIKRYGSYFNIDGFYLLKPNWVLDRKPFGKILQINVGLFRKVAKEVGKNFHTISERKRKLDLLYLIPHSEFIKEQVGFSELFKHIKSRSISKEKIGIKLHPRERNKDFVEKLSKIGDILPLGVPFEALAEQFLTADSTIVGGPSTVFVTSKVILPQRQYYLFNTIEEKMFRECQKMDPKVKTIEI